MATGALALGAWLLVSPLGYAQDDTEEEQVFELSPFTVEGAEEEGYRATSTLAGTRLRTNLKDVGSAISVVTGKFLQDTGSNNSEDLLVYTTGTEVAGQGGNFAGLGDGAMLNDGEHTSPVSNTRVRGLASADNLRDYFLTDIPWDSYNTDRIDLQRGANSILFGIGSPAGIINNTTNTANFDDSNKVGIDIGSFDSYRVSLDMNREVIEDVLAVRFSALLDDKKYRQDPAFRKDERIFLAMRWEPELFDSDSANTSITANFETGDIEGINPRLTPPQDAITPWFEEMDQATYAWQDSNQVTTLGTDRYSPWVGAAGGRIYDGNVVVFDSASDSTQSFAFPAAPQNYPAVSDSSLNDTSNGSYKGILNYNQVGKNLGLPGSVISPYKNKSLTDASIFDFYNNLIEGENRQNNSEFEAYNVKVGQTFLDNKVGLELVYDYQDTSWDYKNFLAYDAATITVDIMETLIDGSPNPNVGRPMVVGGGGSAGSGSTARQRENWRFTAFGELDFNDVLEPDSGLAKILGSHTFTYSRTDQTINEVTKSWNNWYVGSGYAPTAGSSVGQASRDATTITYLGSDLRGLSSASGLYLSRLTAIQEAESTSVIQWDTTTQSYVTYDLPIVNPNSSDYTDATRPLTQLLEYEEDITSDVFVWQGYLFGGDIVPMFGWRKDVDVNANSGAAVKLDGIVTGLDGAYTDEVEGQTRTYSLVAHLPQSLAEKLPWGIQLSAFYNESSNFRPDAGRRDILGQPIPSPTGETKDYGISVSAFDGKFNLKINKYETSVTNDTLAGELGGAYYIGAGEAWGQAAAYNLLNNTGNWPAGENYGTTSAASAYGAGNILRWQPSDEFLVDPSDSSLGYTQEAIDAGYAIQAAAVEDWYANQLPAEFLAAWGMNDYATGGGSWSMNSVAVTGDTLSKGTEYELNMNPIDGLNISINASKTSAKRLSLAAAYTDWIESRYEALQGPMGDMRIWGGGNWVLTPNAGGTVRTDYENQVLPPYQLALALNGSEVPELRPWSFNMVTNYAFQDGKFEGTNVGFGYRWQDKSVTGFALNDTEDGYDVDNKYYGPSEDAVDLWIGYQTSIRNDSVDWKIQLNLRNAFATKDLIPITVQPDGSPAAYRIPEPTTFTLSNTFEF